MAFERRSHWHDGIIVSRELAEKYPKTIEKLRNNEYAALNLRVKVITHPRAYGVWTNSDTHNTSDRLLLTTTKIDGLPYTHIMEEVLSHDYDKARAMQPGGVDRFLKSRRAKKEKADFLSEREKNALASEEETTSTEHKIIPAYTYMPMEFFNNTWLQLDEKQLAVLNHPGDILCSGAPGSGKTLVAIALMAKMLAEEEKAVYIAQSAYLIHEVKEMWLHSPFAKEYTKANSVAFITYANLLETAYPDKKIVDDTHFFTWLAEYTESKKKNKLLYKFLMAQKEEILEECAVLSACDHDIEKYRALGMRECLFFNTDEDNTDKKNVWDVYEKYLNILQTEKSVHPSFTPLNLGELFDYAIFDEAQNLSHEQIQSGCHLAKKIAFFYDGNQRFNQVPKQPFMIKALHNKTKKSIPLLGLGGSYRCAKEITLASNKLLDLKTLIMGASSSKEESLSIESNVSEKEKGIVGWIDPNHLDNMNALKRLIASHIGQYAIVTLAEFKKEAKDIFKTDLIFTVKEIQGLQFTGVIGYRLLDVEGSQYENVLIAANEKLKQLEKQKSIEIKTNRSKDRGAKISSFWNKLFATLTRSLNIFYFCQSTDGIESIQNFLQPILTEDAIKFLHLNKKTKVLSKEELLLVVKGMLQNDDNKKLARSYLVETIGFNEKAADEYINAPLLTSNPLPAFLKERMPAKQSLAKHAPVMMKALKEESDLIKNFAKKSTLDNLRKILQHETVLKMLFFVIIYDNKSKKSKTLYDHIVLNKKKQSLFCDFLEQNLIQTILNFLTPNNKSFFLTCIADVFKSPKTILHQIIMEKILKTDSSSYLYMKKVIVNSTWEHALLLSDMDTIKYLQNIITDKDQASLAQQYFTIGFMMTESLTSAKIVETIITNKHIVENKLIDVNKSIFLNNTWLPPLIHAVVNGSPLTVKLLLGHEHIDINKASACGLTAIVASLRNSDPTILEMLCENDKIDVNCANPENTTALMLAAHNGNLRQVEILLRKADINRRNNKEATALFIAITGKHYDVVKLLLQQTDIKVNTTNYQGFTPLIIAIQLTDPKLIEILLKNEKTDINYHDPAKSSAPVFTAVYYDCFNAIVLLLKRKVALPDIVKRLCNEFLSMEGKLHRAEQIQATFNKKGIKAEFQGNNSHIFSPSTLFSPPTIEFDLLEYVELISHKNIFDLLTYVCLPPSDKAISTYRYQAVQALLERMFASEDSADFIKLFSRFRTVDDMVKTKLAGKILSTTIDEIYLAYIYDKTNLNEIVNNALLLPKISVIPHSHFSDKKISEEKNEGKITLGYKI